MDKIVQSEPNLLQRALTVIKKIWRQVRAGFHDLKVTFLTGFTGWIDPKLQKYRTKNHRQDSSTKNIQAPTLKPNTTSQTLRAENYTPTSTADFLDLLKRTPRSVLSTRERHVIATIINFPTVKVSEIMLPKSAITYVQADEVLGPLTLDRLYRSGFQHFPVLDHNHKIIGLVHTTSFNSLEIKETRRVADILDPKICYVRDDYTLNQALAAFLRTNSYFFLVIDHYERVVGMLTYQMLVDYLLGETPSDNFDRDSDRLAVAKRK